MMQERRILRNTKTQAKERLESLNHFIRELKERCHTCDTEHDHVNEELMKAENDARFYEYQIKFVNDRMKALSGKAKN